MPAASRETYPELKQEMDFDYKWRQKKSVTSNKRPAPIHVTSVNSACMRKSFLKILTENRINVYGVNYFKNFFGGEALHVQLDKFAPTPKECAELMVSRYPQSGITYEKWIETITGIYKNEDEPMGELKMAWNVLDDKPVNLWDYEKNDLTDEVKAYTPEEWLNILVGEMDSAIPYVDRYGKSAMAVLDNKTNVVLPTDTKYPSKVWEDQYEQMSIYAYLLHKNGMVAPKLGGIRTLNYVDRFMEVKSAVISLRKPIRGSDEEGLSMEEELKSRMSHILNSYNTGVLPPVVYTPLCNYCEVFNKCIDGKNVQPKPEIEMGF